jgi:hypothetical protein
MRRLDRPSDGYAQGMAVPVLGPVLGPVVGLVLGASDPLMPVTSRFPLSPSGGLLVPSSALPSGAATRPFGLRYAVRPVECGKHSKRPTQKTRTKPTKIYSDGQESGYELDTEHYVEMDEE